MLPLTSFLRRSLSIGLATFALISGGTVATMTLGGVPPALAQAQEQPGGAPGHGHRMGEILKSLNLSDAQKSQIRSIMADSRNQNKAVTDPEVRRANRKAAMDKVETVLTPAQRTQFEAKRQAMRQQNPAATHS